MMQAEFFALPDFHMHTPRCNHAVGDMVEYAQHAIDRGLSEIGFSDHSPMPNGFDKAWRMDESELGSYIDELEAVKRRFEGRLTIRAALEVDYYPGAEEYINYLSRFYHWDYLMGSVHYIGDWGFDNPDEIGRWESCDVEQAYCDYFDLVAQSARTGLFDTIGHPDLIKKFGFRPLADSSKVDKAENAMLQAIKEADIAMEISSAGLRKPVGEIYPAQHLVKKAAALDIPFSYGSDAHAPTEVGHGMSECCQLLNNCGVQSIASFAQRKRIMRRFVK